MTIHYYRRRVDGIIEHSPRTDVAAEETTIDPETIEPLLGWPTPAMCAELDDDGSPTGWYVGTTPDAAVVEEQDERDRARELAREVAARWPELDHGNGDLRVIAEHAVHQEGLNVSAGRVAAIAREAEQDERDGR